jgi:hypothetical protein
MKARTHFVCVSSGSNDLGEDHLHALEFDEELDGDTGTALADRTKVGTAISVTIGENSEPQSEDPPGCRSNCTNPQ